jgi:hypothetical protein
MLSGRRQKLGYSIPRPWRRSIQAAENSSLDRSYGLTRMLWGRRKKKLDIPCRDRGDEGVKGDASACPSIEGNLIFISVKQQSIVSHLTQYSLENPRRNSLSIIHHTNL